MMATHPPNIIEYHGQKQSSVKQLLLSRSWNIYIPLLTKDERTQLLLYIVSLCRYFSIYIPSFWHLRVLLNEAAHTKTTAVPFIALSGTNGPTIQPVKQTYKQTGVNLGASSWVTLTSDLVGGWATPLKNMSSSIGMMRFPILMGK